MTCTHERRRFCKFRYEVKGEPRWYRACQCLDCGQKVKSPTGGTWWLADCNEKASDLPDFDLELLDICNERDDKQRFEQYAEQRKSGRLKR